MDFYPGLEVVYENDLEVITTYDYGAHGALVELAGKVGVVVNRSHFHDELLGIDFGFTSEDFHRLDGKLPAQTGLWVHPHLLTPKEIKIKSYEELL